MMLPMLLFFITMMTSVLANLEEDHPDRIFRLPGWNQPLPSRWYSGYLEYSFEGVDVHTHYIFVEAEEIDIDETKNEKPLIYWSNGGPGASSMFGLLTEIGPLLLSDDSLDTVDYKTTGIPTLIYNPNSFTRLGSVLIIDQPAPVGFSFCNNDVESHSCGGIAWTDELTSANAYMALESFYKQIPFVSKSKELYLVGESYAGIYIPTLARRILQDTSSGINLKGLAVGDGCLGTETELCGELSSSDFKDFWTVLFMAGHHQIPLSDYRQVMEACQHNAEVHFLKTDSDDDKVCKAALDEVKQELGGYFAYALYDDCTYRNGLLFKGSLNDYACGGGMVMEEYLKLDIVKAAFHVNSVFFEVDNAEGDFDYTPTEPDLKGFYKEVNGKLKVLIYNGDTDPAITSFAAENWTSQLGFVESEHWAPWTIDQCQRMGGYLTRYEGMFDFLTIRGAGHMVPTFKPEATFVFMKGWLEDNYPSYDPNCKDPTTLKGEGKYVRGTIPSTSKLMLRG